MKLHIGGEQPKLDWKILNIQKKDHVDFVGNISDLRQFSSESIDEIYASHVFEHIKLRDALDTLKGIFRILKPGGRFYISVPDLDILCRIFIDQNASKEVKVHVASMIFGGQQDEFDFHFTGWNQEIMFDYLLMAGFAEGKRVESFGLHADTSEYKPYGIAISLNVIAIK